MTTSIKICGVTTFEDATASIQAGARALGFVFYGKSPRCITVSQTAQITSRLPATVKKVGVFVNVHVEQVLDTVLRAGLDMAQLSGDESPEECAWLSSRDVKVVKAVRPRTSDDVKKLARYKDCVHAFNVDGYREGQFGGTGVTSDWTLAREVKAYGRPVILSGGLGPKNIGDAIRSVDPAALDVCSSVEREPGRKDAAKLKLLFDAVRRAEEQMRGGRSTEPGAGVGPETPPPQRAGTPVLVLGAPGSGVQVPGTGSGSGTASETGPGSGLGSGVASGVRVPAHTPPAPVSGVRMPAHTPPAPVSGVRMPAHTPPGGPGSITPIPTSLVPAPPASGAGALGPPPAFSPGPPPPRPPPMPQPQARPLEPSYGSVPPGRLQADTPGATSIDEILLVEVPSQPASPRTTPERPPIGPPTLEDSTRPSGAGLVIGLGRSSRGEKTVKTSRASVPIAGSPEPEPQPQPQPQRQPPLPVPPPAAPPPPSADAGGSGGERSPASGTARSSKVRKMGHFDAAPPPTEGKAEPSAGGDGGGASPPRKRPPE